MNPSVEKPLLADPNFLYAQDPNPNTSVYGTDKKFTIAMLHQSTPRLLVYGGKYVNISEIQLEHLLPFVFQLIRVSIIICFKF